METNIIGKTILETNISQTFFFIGKSTKKEFINKKKKCPTTNSKHTRSIQQAPIGKKTIDKGV